MPSTQAREIPAARRLDNVRYAIRDLAGIADEVIKQGHKVLPLTVGDPNIFDFETPAHIVDAVVKAGHWADTTFLLTWDDWGGYADHVVTPESRAYSIRPS